MSDIQDHIKYFITANRPIHVYINRINRLGFKITGYKFKLETLETIKLFGSAKKLIDKKKMKKISKVVDVVFVQCNLLDNINKIQRCYILL